MADKTSSLINVINKAKRNLSSPILENLSSGIYKAVTVLQNPTTKEVYIDPEGRGRLAAYIPSLGGDPSDPLFFQYASPYGGSVKEGNYGFFGTPVGEAVTILVCFTEGGNATEGYWFAVAQDVPDIVSGGTSGKAKVTGDGQGENEYENIPASKTQPRTLGEEANITSEELENNPRNKVLADQGTYTDTLRGTSSASPKRDASYKLPQENKVVGFKTPGGGSLYIDDGSVNDDGSIHPEQIRMTTASGSSLILDGANDFVYAVNSTGTAWIEIGASGEINAYAEGSLNMRTEKDFNIRADKNINIEAGENIHMHSVKGDTKINSGSDEDESTGEIHLRSKGNQFLQSEAGMNINVGVNCVVTTGGKLHLNGPLAPESELILRGSMPDMQALETTELTNTIVSEMPTHEPFIRPHAIELATSKFAIASASEEGLKNMGTT
jgi:hypothetical protein